MTAQELHNAKNKDLFTSLAAMKRAAILARKRALQTDTAIVILKDEKILRLSGEEIYKAEEKV
jgi:hypothetical protein